MNQHRLPTDEAAHRLRQKLKWDEERRLAKRRKKRICIQYVIEKGEIKRRAVFV